MIAVRKSAERGGADFGWLNSKHTFSFGHYYDPAHMGFGPLRVINEDRVKPRAGFDTHGHSDMEIVSYVLDGALQHADNVGEGSIIRPGDVQRMTAGTGIRHSEYNASDADPVHFLQIWILPEEDGLAPGYEQKSFDPNASRGRLQLVASGDARDGSLKIHQDADIYVTRLSSDDRVDHDLAPGRIAWIQVARGQVRVNGTILDAGDGAAVREESRLTLDEADDAEVLVFDMRAH
ncbi:MAG: pirin family protein [Pseudomonadota bacterium]